MARILQEKTTLVGCNYLAFGRDCAPDSNYYKCRAHQNLTTPSEEHKFIGFRTRTPVDPETTDYDYIAFYDKQGTPFNPLTKGFDLSGLGENAIIFGKMNYDFHKVGTIVPESISFQQRMSLSNITLHPLDETQKIEEPKKMDNVPS